MTTRHSALEEWRKLTPEQQRAHFAAKHAAGPDRPGLATMAASFLGAMRGLVADGGRLAPRDVRKARREACLACPHHDAVRDACAICGCGSLLKGGLAAKRAIASSECPEKPPRWGPV